MTDRYLRVVLDVPLPGPFDYGLPGDGSAAGDPVGRRVLVPWGRGRRIGLVTGTASGSALAPERIRPVERVLQDLPALPPGWLALVRFAAGYYQVDPGQVALPALPAGFRSIDGYRAARPRGGGPVARARVAWTVPDAAGPASDVGVPEPTPDQAAALAALTLDAGFRVHLLYGVTGSGKTEVYLRAIASVLAADPAAQVLLLVPEIALTPQFVRLLAARFPGVPLAALHSALPDGERAAAWLAAFEGRARLVVGTRLAVLVPLARCALIVVDEEHDPSYRQQEGARWSGRDLAVARARIDGVPIVLGSATPSLETWQNAAAGRYARIDLPRRAVADATLPTVRLIDTSRARTNEGLAPAAIAAIEARLARGEQSLIFLNRRGYAPILACQSCGWVADCPHCAATLALHRGGPAAALAPGRDTVRGAVAPDAAGETAGPRRWRLICHHCAHDRPVPRACPTCGEIDLAPLGRGTQRLEETLAERFAGARVLRVDRDATRRRGATEAMLEAVHAGDVDILVGTQMLAKGHDFRRLTLVVVLGADAGLHSHDFRAPERLFATLLQVAGRAGRAELPGEVLIQTRWPSHPLFAALRAHDHRAFAQAELAQRRTAGLPPFAHQALLCADAPAADEAIAFLAAARDAAQPHVGDGVVAVADPVPMPLARRADRERAQLLIESASRPALQAMLAAWLPAIRAVGAAHPRVHWLVDVDPLEI